MMFISVLIVACACRSLYGIIMINFLSSGASAGGNHGNNYVLIILFYPPMQLVWAQTYAVGCGVSRCTELEGAEDDGENALYFVCYYGPG